MADRIEAPTFTIPAQTPQVAPAVAALFDDEAVVSTVEIVVPPGPSGLIGLALWHSNEQVIPHSRGQWIVPTIEVIRWNLEDYPTGDAWQIRGYNLDIYDHTVYLRLMLNRLDTRAPTPVVIRPIEPVQLAEVD